MSAPVIHHFQNRVMGRFHGAGATSPETARKLEEIGQRESLVFKYLCARGVIVQAGGGLYYLDPVGERRFRKRRFRLVATVLGVVLAALATMLLFTVCQ